MIQELHISNLAVIEDTTLEFNSNFVSLIGETGAGKSLIVDSLNLLKGDKSDFSLVRDNTKKATIIASFKLDKNFILEHEEIKEYLDGTNVLLLKRTLNPDHTSKTYINDEPVSLNEFKRISSHLIDIHSQGANWDLLDEKKHLSYLDKYALNDIKKAKDDFLVSYKKYKNSQEKLKKLIENNSKLDKEYLTFQIEEIKKVNLKEHEIEDLNEEYSSLRQMEQIQNNFNSYKESILLPEGNIKDILFSIRNKLSKFDNSPLQEEARQLFENINNVNDSFNLLEETYHSLSLDPNRIDYINSRLFQLKSVQRKYGKTTDEILSKLKLYESELSECDDFENLKLDLQNEIDKEEKETIEKAKILSKKRQKAATQLEKSISTEMEDLGLLKDGFKVSFVEDELNSDGIDKITFEVRLNKGLEFTSLKKAASGGEASRLMLSLKVVLNALDPYDLLVFDEIDSGVSGRIASLIANKIKKVASSSQVLVISHLAQVVSSSFSAIKITKYTTNKSTSTKATTLNEEEFEVEVAKLLSGEKITESAISQAKELIKESRG